MLNYVVLCDEQVCKLGGKNWIETCLVFIEQPQKNKALQMPILEIDFWPNEVSMNVTVAYFRRQ